MCVHACVYVCVCICMCVGMYDVPVDICGTLLVWQLEDNLMESLFLHLSLWGDRDQS